MNSPELDIEELFRTFARQKFLIAISALVILLAGAAFIFSLQPAYTSTVTLIVDPSNKNLLDPGSSNQSSASADARIESEVRIVTAETTLQNVIDRLDLLDDPEFAAQPGFIDRTLISLGLAEPEEFTEEERRLIAVAILRGATQVSRNGLTYLISISATADDPQSAVRIANVLADTYVRSQIELKITSTLSARDIITERVAQAEESVVAAQEALDNFLLSSAEAIIDETGNTELEVLQDEVSNATSTRSTLNSTMEQARQALQLGDYTSLAEYLNSDSVRSLAETRADMQEELSDSLEGQANTAELRERLAELDTRLVTEAEQRIGFLRDEITAARAREADIRLRFRTALIDTDLPPQVVADLFRLQQESQLARNQYQTLLTRLSDLEEQAYLQVADSRIVSPAVVPDGPSFPNRRVLLMLAALVAATVGLGIGLLREASRGAFQSVNQFETVLGVPVIAQLPRPSRKHKGRVSAADDTVQAPLSLYAESLRRLALGVEQVIGRNPAEPGAGSVVIVTSAGYEEDKTSTALGIARTLAISGQKTLLIECDLRQPVLHSHLGLEPKGLPDASGPDGRIQLVPQDDPMTPLKVVLADTSESRDATQLSSQVYTERLIETAASQYEFVILNTPPLNAVADGFRLIQFADAIVLIARFLQTKRSEVSQVVDDIIEAKRPNAELLGVLSDAGRGAGEFGNKFSKYYSD